MNFVNKRNLGIDILCCVGVLMLLALQYMEAAGFRTMPFTSWSTALPVMIRWFCLSGAALLSAGTGYILCAKKWSTGYFKILIRLVYIYLVCSALGLVMRVFLFNDFIDGTDILRTIFSFSATETSRFAGMYFALLIAAPYLNACFHGLKSRRAQFSLLAMLSSHVQLSVPTGTLCPVTVIVSSRRSRSMAENIRPKLCSFMFLRI